MFSECLYNVLTSGQVWAGTSIPIPGKHETSTQCWTNVGPASWTVAQHWTNIGSMFPVCWERFKYFNLSIKIIFITDLFFVTADMIKIQSRPLL